MAKKKWRRTSQVAEVILTTFLNHGLIYGYIITFANYPKKYYTIGLYY